MKRKLKIAVLSGGVFVHTEPYVQYLVSQGHEVCWITFSTPGRDIGVCTFDLSRSAKRSTNSFEKLRYLMYALRLKQLLKQIQPDILHGHYATSAGLMGMLSGFDNFVITAHGSDVLGSLRSVFWKNMLRLIFKKAAVINPVSKQICSEIEGMGVDKSKILTATLGVDTDRFGYRDCTKLNRPVRLVCTRKLGKVYDNQTILRACSLLKQQGVDFRMLFVADGPQKEELRQLAGELGIESRVVFQGGYDNDRLPQLLHECDIYLSASLWDGTSISLLEAMACGCFAIVSRIPSNMAWLVEGKSALMFDCGNYAELAKQIRYAVENPDVIQPAIQLNRTVVESEADRRQNMAAIEERYYRLVCEKGLR